MKITKLILIFLSLFISFSFLSCTQNNQSVTKPYITDNDELDTINNENYSIIPNTIYYVLIDEYLDNNDIDNPDINIFKRFYIVYDGVQNQAYPHAEIVGINKINDIQEARKILMLDNPDGLKLLPNTIVSNKVLDKWQLENYDGLGSYSKDSPKDLNYLKIQEIIK